MSFVFLQSLQSLTTSVCSRTGYPAQRPQRRARSQQPGTMRTAGELDLEAEAKEVKADGLQAEAFAMLEAGDKAWVIKGEHVACLRDFAIFQRQQALVLRQQQSSNTCNPKKREGQSLNEQDVGRLLDDLEARMTKRARRTVTDVLTTGQTMLNDSHCDASHLDSFLAGGDEKVAEQFVKSPEGRVLKEQWEQAQGEEDIQECLNSMVPALLLLLHSSERGPSRQTYYGTHEEGFRKKSMAICEGSRPVGAHIGTFIEATLNLHMQQQAVVGQSWDRVQALQHHQLDRNTWRIAVIGKEAFQLWEFKTSKSGRSLQSTCSSMHQFSLEINSPGFRLFVRWLATDLKALGFISPPLPGVVAPSDMAIESVIMGDDASHADEPAKKRQHVLVFKVQTENNKAAVAKIPCENFRYAREVTNLKVVQTLPGLRDRTTMLAGTAKLQHGHEVLDALIIKPYAHHIRFDTPYQQLVSYMQQYVGTVECLYKAGYLHRDLSYSNLLVTGDNAIISDWETMITVEEEQAFGAGGLQTGTPLFAAVSTLCGGPHTLSSELETLFNIMLYILSGGVLHWQGIIKEHHHLITVRRGVMIEGEFERIALKRVKKACWPALQRLRAVFFPLGGSRYRTDVSCQDFLTTL